MICRILPSLAFAAAVIAHAGSSRGAATEPAGRDAAQSTAAFGVDLYRLLAAKEGNVFLSPCSISEALALLSEGAAGKTGQEILQALHWKLPPGDMAAAFEAQDLQLGRAVHDGVVLSVANGLWYQQGGAPLAAFQNVAQSGFRAEVRAVDFIGNSAAVGPEINGWVNKKTAGMISDLFPAGSLTRDTRLVLANAVYFKGRWANPFEAGATAARPFYPTADQSVQAPTMFAFEKLKAATVDDCDLLELPYAGGELSMVILLPVARGGLAAVEQQLSPEKLALWMASLDSAQPGEIQVRMPRFKVTTSSDLAGPLEQLGIKAAFASGEADFSAINGRRDLHVSAVYHKAFVDVNEEGTEAAAAAGTVLMAFAVEKPRLFTADHPFLFLVRDNLTGCLLFLARISDPTKN